MKNHVFFIRLLITTLVLFCNVAKATTEVANASALRKHYHVDGPVSPEAVSQLKVAVLDNGFMGYSPGSLVLPASTILKSDYSAEFLQRNHLSTEAAGNPLLPVRHGLMMAQLVWALSGQLPTGPQFYLLNANGLTQFERAVATAMEEKVDIILFSQNWEYGGNFDGQGVFNTIVSRATASGILWINAAGNYGGSVFNGRVEKEATSDFLVLPGKDSSLAFENKLDENPVTFVLNWNDYTDEEAYQTRLDLDLYLYDAKGKLLSKGDRTQVEGGGGRGAKSKYAKEFFTLNLDRGSYYLKIKNSAGKVEYDDRLRIVIKSEKDPGSIDLADHTRGREIMIPADHPQVVTVGDTGPFSAVGPTMDGREKPEVKLDESRAVYTTGEDTVGSSNAAAIFAGLAVLLKMDDPHLDRASLVRYGKGLLGAGSAAATVQLPSSVIQALSRYSNLSPQDWQVRVNEEGRKVIYLPLLPFNIPFLFGNALSESRRLFIDPREFAYFIAPALNPGQNPVGVDTFYFWNGRPLPLPMDHAPSSADGPRWIEVRALTR